MLQGAGKDVDPTVLEQGIDFCRSGRIKPLAQEASLVMEIFPFQGEYPAAEHRLESPVEIGYLLVLEPPAYSEDPAFEGQAILLERCDDGGVLIGNQFASQEMSTPAIGVIQKKLEVFFDIPEGAVWIEHDKAQRDIDPSL